MLNTAQKNFVKETIEYYFNTTMDEIKIRAIILSYLEDFSDFELETYNERLINMRGNAYDYYLQKKKEEEEAN